MAEELTDREIALIERVAEAVANRISIPQQTYGGKPKRIRFSVNVSISFYELGVVTNRDAGRFRDKELIAKILQRILEVLYPRYDEIEVKLTSKFNGSEGLNGE